MKALSGLQTTSLSSWGPSTSTHGQKKQGSFRLSYFYKDSNLVGSGLWPLWRHLCVTSSFKTPSSNTITLRVRVLVYEFWGDANIQSITADLSLSVNTLTSCLTGKREGILQKPLLIPTIKLTISAVSDIAISSFLLLQHRMEEFLCLPKADLALDPCHYPLRNHSLLSSSPVLKFTLLLALSQEHLNLLLSSLLKNKNKKLSLGPSISLQLPPSLCPRFRNNLL